MLITNLYLIFAKILSLSGPNGAKKVAQMNEKYFSRNCIKLGKEAISNILITNLYLIFGKILSLSGTNEAKKWHK